MGTHAHQIKSDREMSATPVCHQAVQHMTLHKSWEMVLPSLQLSRNSQIRKGRDILNCQSEQWRI